ncbi:MAG: glycoside hydrolase family 3 C-terminal domain-containing protein [Oscillospiraceae bacterium]|jgi:beta-glucosidase|nr:glycoside hydrolase family 3 C-terminal domain-containing protein [Oscillospiraceae bacterium]
MAKNRFSIDFAQYAETSRALAAEGAVLVRNGNGTLPLRRGETVAVFGRTQLNWYKSGTGSGGMVNTKYAVGLAEALRGSEYAAVDAELSGVYSEWEKTHPFDRGQGWAQEPWAQEEMPLDETVVAAAAKRCGTAVVIIGRTAGEDKDNKAEKGSYYLTDVESDMLKKVTAAFPRTVVVLNVGNIIDMNWIDEYQPGAVLYAWHGGQVGGLSVADVLTGAVNPSGGLADTIAFDLGDHPSAKNFGGDEEAVYAEDIYVGYRWFESAAKEKVRYPFGFGLSYTRFTFDTIDREVGETTTLKVRVTNAGGVPGKTRALVFVSAPQGALGKPARVLAAYAKTDLLLPGGSQILNIAVPSMNFASYDDAGVTGHRSAWVLEAGDYDFFVGTDVRSAAKAFGFTISDLACLGHLEEALAPVKPFRRLKNTDDGMTEEDAPLRTVDLARRIADELAALPQRVCTGDRGIKLADVYDGKAGFDEFLNQIPNETLACIVRGEGMNSPKVTSGTAGAYGGLTGALAAFGIPVSCVTDGPSGMRMDPVEASGFTGGFAFSLPNGTCIACSFNAELTERLFEFTGREMRRNRVDLLLGPGVNIHRNPLGGRNFEYFSEDPYLTGTLAAAELRGLHKSKVSGTPKHFSANNQEHRRFMLDSVMSERALREIYLKGYEIAVSEGGMMSVMTTYGRVNGVFTAGSFELCTTILRGDWGFDGIAMTDWGGFADMPDFGPGGPGAMFAPPPEGTKPEDLPPPPLMKRAAMVRAQNDLYMVTQDTLAENGRDDITSALADGTLTRSELHRNAANILSVILRTPVIDRALGRLSDEELAETKLAEAEDNIGIVG